MIKRNRDETTPTTILPNWNLNLWPKLIHHPILNIFPFVFVLASCCLPFAYANDYSTVLSDCKEFLNDCRYYLCRDSIQPCGDEGYFVKFGYNYCEKFTTEKFPQFSTEGQVWIPKAAQCLREELYKTSLDFSCEKVTELAVSSHEGCYIDTGFCKIPFSDKFRIFQTIRHELSNSQMLSTLFRISAKCGI